MQSPPSFTPNSRARVHLPAPTLVLLVLLFPTEAGSATRKLTLNGLEIGLDESTGGIVSMSYPGVGLILETEPESAGPLDVAFPLPDYVPMRLASRFSRAELEKIDGGIAIVWRELAPSRTHVRLPPGSISARVSLTAAPDGRSTLMRCRIENRKSQPIPQVLFPDFSGLRALGAPGATRLTMARGAVTPFTQRGEN